jgi:hypothetical protein
MDRQDDDLGHTAAIPPFSDNQDSANDDEDDEDDDIGPQPMQKIGCKRMDERS